VRYSLCSVSSCHCRVATAPVMRTGKSMSRRTGQPGHIELSGKEWAEKCSFELPSVVSSVPRKTENGLFKKAS
jgi:hypothetical protein